MTINSVIGALYRQLDQLDEDNSKKSLCIFNLESTNRKLKKQIEELEHYRDEHILYLEKNDE